MTGARADLPALLGGAAVRPEGPPSWPPPDPVVGQTLEQLARSGEWGRYHGPWNERLASDLAASLGVRHVLLCCSGTAAVELALRAVGVSSGDEVLLAAYEFKANFTNVAWLGARPVLVDVRPDDAQFDVRQLDALTTERTRCVIASHLHGGWVDLPRLREWCTGRGMALLEDACQASGGTISGKPAGTSGDVGVLSFGGSKLLTAGRGGAVLTDRDDIAQRIRLFTQRGNDAYPLSEMQAAVLVPQVDVLAERHRRRAAAAQHLSAELQPYGLTALHTTSTVGDPAYYKLGFWYSAAEYGGMSRERLTQALRAEGIAVDPGFRALHRIHARSRFRTAGELPHAEAAEGKLLTLHHPVLLGTSREIDQVVEAVRKVQLYAKPLQLWTPPDAPEQ